jgi:hypothetical protein
MSDQTAALHALLDKQEITELLTRYLRSVDRGDVDTLRACYLPGATEDHGGLFAGPAAEYVDSITRDLTHPRPDHRWGIAHRQLVWDWNHDAPAAEHWMQGLLTPDPSVLHMSAKYPADPIYAPR